MIYICISLYIIVYIHIYICIHAYMYIFIHMSQGLHRHHHIWPLCIYKKYIYIHICMCVCIYIYIYICIYVGVYMYMYIYIYVYRADPSGPASGTANGPASGLASETASGRARPASDPRTRLTLVSQLTLCGAPFYRCTDRSTDRDLEIYYGSRYVRPRVLSKLRWSRCSLLAFVSHIQIGRYTNRDIEL